MREAMLENGIFCDNIIADGKIHRFGKNNRCWYVCFGNAGSYGDWSQGFSSNWNNGKTPVTDEEGQNLYFEMAESKRIREQETARYVAEQWGKFATTGDSQYLQTKKVGAYGVRFGGDFFVVPLVDSEGTLWSYQTIYANGKKLFLSGGRKHGCFHIIGTIEEGKPLYLSEGYATAASIHMATGAASVIAFDAGNLEPVAGCLRAKYPHHQIIIAADNDLYTAQNTGKIAAEKAATAHQCSMALPQFADTSEKPTDFNDLHCLEGLQVVTSQLSQPKESDAAAITRLASLSLMQYDRISAEEAKRLGVSKSVLDKEVKKRREAPADSNAGSSELFPDEEVWGESVSAAAILDELAATFRRFAILPPHADTTLALWVMFTWCTQYVNVAPILAICSPEKQCGKTTVLTIISQTVVRALATSNISSSSLFRAIEAWQPTMLIDEADTFIRESDELRGILNSGHTRPTAFVIRNVGDEHKPKQFSTWGAKALALIGKLPDTLHDRSIVIELRRKLKGEKTDKLRHAESDMFLILRAKLKRFARDYAASIRRARPTMPDNISDRAADNWEPLVALAELASKEWGQKARAAMGCLSSRNNDAASLGTELLADIEGIFNTKQCDKISSASLIELLCTDEERPWASYNRGKQISPRQIGRLLTEYGISSKTIRLGNGDVLKGYERHQFQDAFFRYLAISPDLSVIPLQFSDTVEFDVTDVDYEDDV